jgi:hypothetical protein
VIPADISVQSTWNFNIGGTTATDELLPLVDSPAGYINTYQIEYIYPDIPIPYQWTMHLRPGEGILDEYDFPAPDTTEGYNRSDIPPDAG